jgi:hypothetical protein
LYRAGTCQRWEAQTASYVELTASA